MRHLVFYGLPDHDHFYAEIATFLAEATLNGDTTSSTALFTRYDQFALERIAGVPNARRMLMAAKDAHILY